MVDRITFTVPAGTYPEGVAATLRGTFKGWIQSDVGAGCQVTVSVSFGDQDYSLPLQAVGTDVAGTLFFDAPIALTLALVAPGGELPQATEYARDLAAALGNCHAWPVAYHDGSGCLAGNAEAQFHDGDNGLILSALEVTPGVQWRSESGVFLTRLSSVPPSAPAATKRPGTAGTGLLMAAGTYVCRIRTRQGAAAGTLVLLR